MRRRYHLGLPFAVYCGLTILVASAAVNGGSNLLFWVFGVLISALLISGVTSAGMLLGLEVRRVIPAHGEVGEVLAIRYAARNRSRLLPGFNIHIEERPVPGRRGWDRMMPLARAWLLHVGPRELIHGEAAFRPTRRGEARFDALRIRTSFPFGILGKSITISRPQRALIHPRLHHLRRRVLESIVPIGAVGMQITPHAGAGDDYYGLREFRTGDSMRHIAWKRTANRDQLVCIERTSPSPPRLRVVLNLARSTAEVAEGGTGAETARELEELAIELAASIVNAADLAGYEVGLTILGVSAPPIAVRRSARHQLRMMAALAEIDLDADRVAPDSESEDLERIGLVVVHPDRHDIDVVRGEAWHFSARQLEHLVDAFAPADATREPSARRERAAEEALA